MTSIEEFETRRRAVADQILAEPEQFDMDSFGYQTKACCGTVTCLAGTAVLQAEKLGQCTVRWSQLDGHPDFFLLMDGLTVANHFGVVAIDDFARKYLGLQTDSLFYRFELTAEEAAKALLEAPYVS